MRLIVAAFTGRDLFCPGNTFFEIMERLVTEDAFLLVQAATIFNVFENAGVAFGAFQSRHRGDLLLINIMGRAGFGLRHGSCRNTS